MTRTPSSRGEITIRWRGYGPELKWIIALLVVLAITGLVPSAREAVVSIIEAPLSHW